MPKDFRLSLLVFVAVLAGAVSLISAPGSAQADSWWAQAGWIQSDTGLVRDGDGLWAGVEGRRPLGIGPVDIGYSLAYAQKVGSVILVFSHPLTGFLVGPAEVTLHTLEAAVTPGIGADLGPARATVFGGAAIALKLAETWDTPFGTPAQDYSYEDIDLALVMGVSLAYGPWMLDFRFDVGTKDQLLLQGDLPTKAADPVGDNPLPAAGNRIDSLRLGLGYRFSGP